MSTALSPAQLEMTWTDATRALRDGRMGEAVQLLGRIVASGQATAPVHVALALAHKALGQPAEKLAALEQALAADPRDLRALLMSADHHAEAGDERAASSFYDAVVKVAVANGEVEPALQAEVGRAHHMRERYARAFEDHLRRSLKGLDGAEARRAARSIDLLVGRSELYLQQPRGYYFPELPNIQYAPRQDFPWLDRVEAATDDIRAELVRIIEADAGFSPYVEAEANRPFFDDHGMLGNPDWSAFYIWKGGSLIAENAARCPATVAALADAPLCQIPGRTPSVLFSLLKPGAHIQPHHGFTNARYICHLPLIVPGDCAMRVGSETRPWVEGQACVFDDSIEHEAWNRHAERLRVVLIFDIWRPELSDTERRLVSEILQAVDSYR